MGPLWERGHVGMAVCVCGREGGYQPTCCRSVHICLTSVCPSLRPTMRPSSHPSVRPSVSQSGCFTHTTNFAQTVTAIKSNRITIFRSHSADTTPNNEKLEENRRPQRAIYMRNCPHAIYFHFKFRVIYFIPCSFRNGNKCPPSCVRPQLPLGLALPTTLPSYLTEHGSIIGRRQYWRVKSGAEVIDSLLIGHLCSFTMVVSSNFLSFLRVILF